MSPTEFVSYWTMFRVTYPELCHGPEIEWAIELRRAGWRLIGDRMGRDRFTCFSWMLWRLPGHHRKPVITSTARVMQRDIEHRRQRAAVTMGHG